MVTKQLHMIPVFVRILGGLGEPVNTSSPEISLIGRAGTPTSWRARKYMASAIDIVCLLWISIPYYSKYALPNESLNHLPRLISIQYYFKHVCTAKREPQCLIVVISPRLERLKFERPVPFSGHKRLHHEIPPGEIHSPLAFGEMS
jgi:hypothetical protein